MQSANCDRHFVKSKYLVGHRAECEHTLSQHLPDLDKIVRTQKEKENPAKPATQTNTSPTPQPSSVKSSDELPKLIKPSQVKPNRITDTGTGGLSPLELKKIQKGITDEDYEYLVAALGNETLANNAILVNAPVQLRRTIDKEKDKQKEFSMIANPLLLRVSQLNKTRSGTLASSKSSETPSQFGFFGQAVEKYKEDAPYKSPSSIDEYNGNLEFFLGKSIELQIEDIETPRNTSIEGVQGAGITLRAGAGGSGSISVYRVYDKYGNSGILLSTNAGGMAGAPQISGTVDYINGKNLDNIYQLEGGALTNGGSISVGPITFGTEVVKPVSDGEEIPAYTVYSAGAITPSPVPLEYHAEYGKTWIMEEDNNVDYVIRQQKIDDLKKQLERYKINE